MDKIDNKSKSAGISIPTNLLSKIDKDRGDISRSRYIVRIIEQGIFQKRRNQLNANKILIYHIIQIWS